MEGIIKYNNENESYTLTRGSKSVEYVVPQRPSLQWLNDALRRKCEMRPLQSDKSLLDAVIVDSETLLGIADKNFLSEGEMVLIAHNLVQSFPDLRAGEIQGAVSLYCAKKIGENISTPHKLNAAFLTAVIAEYNVYFAKVAKEYAKEEAAEIRVLTPSEAWQYAYATYTAQLRFNTDTGDILGVGTILANAVSACFVACYDTYTKAGIPMISDADKRIVFDAIQNHRDCKIFVVQTWCEVALATQNSTAVGVEWDTFRDLIVEGLDK